MMHDSDTDELEAFLLGHKPLPTFSTFPTFGMGDMLGCWRITEFLGKGGNGEVYRAEFLLDSRNAALKVHIRRPGASDSQENSARERFKREARILSSNSYPFFPRFFESGEARGYLYFVIELLAPISLPDTDGAVASFLLELCNAVRTLHGNGFIHRDIKPQNIMRRADGQLVLIDLGLVKESAPFARHTGASVTLVDGKVVGVGTPQYAAPEQFSGGVVSPATDIHALGMLANECFGGRPPRAWERIISRSTSSIPERRYVDIDAFAAAIRRRHSGRIAAWVLSICIPAVIGALAYFGLTRAPSQRPSLNIPVPVERPSWRDIATDVSTNIVERKILYEKYSTNDHGTVVMTEWAWRIVTNSVAGTVLRLDNKRHKFEDPILLETNRCYWVVGPGTLDASIDGRPGSRLILDNCVLINRTSKTLEQCGIHYVFRKGSYLNFINQECDDGCRSYIEDFDGAYNALEFQGPESVTEVLKRRDAETRRMLDESQ